MGKYFLGEALCNSKSHLAKFMSIYLISDGPEAVQVAARGPS